MRKDGLQVSPDTVDYSDSVKERVCVVANNREEDVAFAVRTTHPKEFSVVPKMGRLKSGEMVGVKFKWRGCDEDNKKPRVIVVLMRSINNDQEVDVAALPWREMTDLVGKFRLPVTISEETALTKHLLWARDSLARKGSSWNFTIPFSKIATIPSEVTSSITFGFANAACVTLRSIPALGTQSSRVSLLIQPSKLTSEIDFNITILTPSGKVACSKDVTFKPNMGSTFGVKDLCTMETITSCLYEAQTSSGMSEPCFTLKVVVDCDASGVSHEDPNVNILANEPLG
eukprot:TRINITY_DN4862_c1_g1_i1.p1 TRINITY_DN4862_c1_g1~~TRINITY_DN4862_c1_g1_i1.p1  ORF type:complete len:286 (+),score=38.53 TRINITY_DN4862_c1_g1_i1:40-897(+)